MPQSLTSKPRAGSSGSGATRRGQLHLIAARISWTRKTSGREERKAQKRAETKALMEKRDEDKGKETSDTSAPSGPQPYEATATVMQSLTICGSYKDKPERNFWTVKLSWSKRLPRHCGTPPSFALVTMRLMFSTTVTKLLFPCGGSLGTNSLACRPQSLLRMTKACSLSVEGSFWIGRRRTATSKTTAVSDRRATVVSSK